jgi:hypothetical protein
LQAELEQIQQRERQNAARGSVAGDTSVEATIGR